MLTFVCVQENNQLKNRVRAVEVDSRARISAVELDLKRFQDEVRSLASAPVSLRLSLLVSMMF